MPSYSPGLIETMRAVLDEVMTSTRTMDVSIICTVAS
jgi:hypothetical protein